MGLFGKSKSKHTDYDILANLKPGPLSDSNLAEIHSPASNIVPDVDDLEYARTTVEQFTVELRDSAAMQQSAIKRISTLNSVISKMELDIRALRRVQAENRNLTKTVTELDSKLSQKTSWSNEQDSKLGDLEKRHAEARNQLEDAKAGLAASRDQEAAYQAENANHERTIRALTAKFQTAEDRLNHNDNTIDKMQNRLDTQTGDLAQRERHIVELRNTLDEINEKYTQRSAYSDTVTVEMKNLRVDYADLKSKHVEVTGQMENLRYDLQTQRNVGEDTVKRRDEENMALKTRIDQLDTQIRIKENMATHLDQEFISLRNALVNERDRAESLEDRLRQKSEEYERSAKALAKSKKAFEQINVKFASTLEDYENLRNINELMRQKLEKYASISGVSSGQSLMNTEVYSKEKVVDDSLNVTRLKKSS